MVESDVVFRRYFYAPNALMVIECNNNHEVFERFEWPRKNSVIFGQRTVFVTATHESEGMTELVVSNSTVFSDGMIQVFSGAILNGGDRLHFQKVDHDDVLVLECEDPQPRVRVAVDYLGEASKIEVLLDIPLVESIVMVSRFTRWEQEKINEIGAATGCHRCGVRVPGSRSGNFVIDTQPVTALVAPGTPQRHYPHCVRCSAMQGGVIAQIMLKER